MIKSGGSTIQPEHLNLIDAAPSIESVPQNNEELKAAKAKARKKAEERLERQVLTQWLSRTHGNVSCAAKQIGMNRSYLSQLVSKHQLDIRQFEKVLVDD